MWNVAVPKKFETDLLLHGKGQERFKPLLVDAAIHLERMGVDTIVLPCNTLHIFADDIQRSIKIPFVNIIKTVLKTLKTKNIRKIGLLGTLITINNNLFKSTHETKFILPNRVLQTQLDMGFHQRVVHGTSEKLHDSVKRIINTFEKQNIHDVLLASTDLHDSCSNRSNLRILDTLEILAKRTARLFFA